MTNSKYSKSSDFYGKLKKDFFESNDSLLEEAESQNGFYSSQPIRILCKLCDKRLSEEKDFYSHGVNYVFCDSCGHLNGMHEDTQEFVERLYIANSGAEYAKSYIDNNYKQRVVDIYLPKVDFLKTNLPPNPYKVLDVGCGAGYFVAACSFRDITAHGVDVSKSMIEFGNKQLGLLCGQDALLKAIDENDYFETIAETQADVVSAIGVIEHLRFPKQFFEAFRKSNASYLYYSVPMFSFSAVLESVTGRVFPRQLSGDHTHLFTETSRQKMHELLEGDSLAEWRFGTDVMDLYRAIMTMLSKNDASDRMLGEFSNSFSPLIDQMQTVLDKAHFCSEIHCLVCKKTVSKHS